MSTLKVDTIATRTGSGNITASNTIAGTSATLSGTLGVTGAITGTTQILNKASSGTVLDLKLSDTSIGGLGVISDRVYLEAEGSHSVYLDASANNFNPGSATGTDNDGNIDLGASFARWKDLYLSSGLYIGGTGTANKLDDYEEGTFTPTFGGSGGNPTVSYSVQIGTYIKVGNMVQLTVSIIASGTPSGGGGDLVIFGVPFTAKAGVQQAGTVSFTNNMNFGGGSGISQVGCNIEGNVSYLNINEHEYSGSSGMGRNPTNGITTHANPRIVCSICYETA
tara:strand:- start:384 stop:1223 length:840 start_codon:yes stop_codon:yes gene_type:complete